MNNVFNLAKVIGCGDENSTHAVGLKINKMSYPFYLEGVFPENFEKGDIEDYVSMLALEYMKEWMLEFPKEEFEKNLSHLFYFQKKYDFGKILGSLSDDTPLNFSEVLMPVSNAMVQLKRFGDSLGLRLKGNNQNPNEEHSKGTALLKKIITTNPGLFVREFFHSMEVSIPLRTTQGENNSEVINFLEVYRMLKKVCHYVDWVDECIFIAKITGEAYLKPFSSERAVVGSSRKEKLPITARLIHPNSTSVENSLQWRIGNIKKLGENGEHQFLDGRGLRLSLQVENPFERNNEFRNVPKDLKIGQIQRELELIGAGMYFQLCVMNANR